jgi:triosephosphate isomerase
MSKLIMANWKMEAEERRAVRALLTVATRQAPRMPHSLILFPSHPWIPIVRKEVSSRILMGAQDVSEYARGPYTGEVSAKGLAELGCRYVLVGHSERRAYYGEGDPMVATKYWQAVAAGLTPVLCVGESAVERRKGRTFARVRQQLHAVFGAASARPRAQGTVVIAYEPVWAVGTGTDATPPKAARMARCIKENLRGHLDAGSRVRVVYGGSVDARTVASYLRAEEIAGVLVGAASAHPLRFRALLTAVSRS